jgi:hypothetical protein
MARANLDTSTELMVSLRAQLETIEVQLLHDSQLAKNKRMKKTQRVNMERIATSMRADLDVAIADVDVLSEHVAQLVQSVGSAAAAAAAEPPPPTPPPAPPAVRATRRPTSSTASRRRRARRRRRRRH